MRILKKTQLFGFKPVSALGDVSSGVAWKYRPEHYAADGLNSLRYKLVASEPRPLYTWLLVTLPPHPTYFKGSYRVNLSGNARTLSVRGRCWFVMVLLSVINELLFR